MQVSYVLSFTIKECESDTKWSCQSLALPLLLAHDIPNLGSFWLSSVDLRCVLGHRIIMQYMIDPPSDEVLSPSPHVMDCELRSWAADFYKKLLFSFDYPALMIHQQSLDSKWTFVVKQGASFGSQSTMKSVDTDMLKSNLTFSWKDSLWSTWSPFGTSSLPVITLSVMTLKEVTGLV